ncbi:hypothetical protein C7123_11930 [Tannerella serpentiformis]|uniref:hypothetical protein n=1 Tax=Tannerella serpentiformis TaxID=712710 RepID=UPI000840A537|nr:hypothetical protein [Tannerella serpentiformis]AOH40440.1 hypothetical protein BCB71_04430 [Tannerella serpentiformis]AVV54341.1 hypothetical protein C7123_11930 [Tannerella serpentiformis]
MNTPTKTTIPPEFTPAYVPYSYKGQPVKGAFGANTRPSFVKASDRAYFEADNTLSNAMRQLMIAMDVLDTGAGMRPVGDFNYCNIKARRGQSGRLGDDKVEGSLDPYANYANHIDFARAKLQLIQHPRWGVNLKTDTPSEVIDKIEGTPIVWGTLFSPAAQRALERGEGIDDLKLDYEKAIVKRYRALGITDIQSARKKYYCEKMTAIGRQVALYMAGGDPNVTYTPDFERKATPIEPPVVPPIRPAAPGAPAVPPQPTLVQGPTPITPAAFDALAFTRKTRARLMDGREVYVTAVDFERRQVKFYNEKDAPYWVNLDKVAAII